MDKRIAAVGAAAAALGIAASIALSPRPSEAPEAANTAPGPGADAQANFVMPPAETFDPVFEPCAHCHQVGVGARHTSGPQLNGVIGRAAASTDYPYSEAMKKSGLRWDEVTLTRFLVSPDAVVPGTRMLFQGMPETDARRVVRYLRSVDGRPRSDDGAAASSGRP